MDSSLNVDVTRRITAYCIDSPLYLPQSVQRDVLQTRHFSLTDIKKKRTRVIPAPTVANPAPAQGTPVAVVPPSARTHGQSSSSGVGSVPESDATIEVPIVNRKSTRRIETPSRPSRLPVRRTLEFYQDEEEVDFLGGNSLVPGKQ